MQPAAARVRPAVPADADAVAAVHVTSWREAYVGLLPARTLARLSVAHRTARWRDILAAGEHPVLVAYDGEGVGGDGAEEGAGGDLGTGRGGILGFGCCGAQSARSLARSGYDGQVLALYVLRAAQRRGIGRMLVAAMAEVLVRKGARGASLSVLEGNLSARKFCEALGGTPIGRQQGQRDDATLTEIAYGWRSLASLRDTALGVVQDASEAVQGST